ncbi:hypothetical protein NBRC116602_13280 [Hyphomicrobiales bacterium 4NK60-0047b]
MFFFSRLFYELKLIGLRGAALTPVCAKRFAMSLSPKWAELLLRIVRFVF